MERYIAWSLAVNYLESQIVFCKCGFSYAIIMAIVRLAPRRRNESDIPTRILSGRIHIGSLKKYLTETNAELAAQCHPTKNEHFTPYDMVVSVKKGLVAVRKGTRTESFTTRKKCQRQHNCPYCPGRRAMPGEAELATVNPSLAEQ